MKRFKVSQHSFRTNLLFYNLVVFLFVLIVLLVIGSYGIKVVNDLSRRINAYFIVDSLAEELTTGKNTLLKIGKALDASTDKEPQEAISSLFIEHDKALQEALILANKLTVPYFENPEKYFLTRATISGIEYLINCNKSLENESSKKGQTFYSHYYYYLKVYDYLLQYSADDFLSVAVSNDAKEVGKSLLIVENLKTLVIVFIILFIIFYVFLITFVTSKLVKPIFSMVNTAKDIQDGKFDTPDLCDLGPSEFVFLEDNMNQMKHKLSVQIELERLLFKKKIEQSQISSELEKARFYALQSQINPHFLFNTLNTISRTAYFEKDYSTVNLIKKLSDIYRYILEFKDTVTIEMEFAILKQYLDIQQVRFGSRLTYNFHLEPALIHEQIPPLIIQPFVENSVIHGIEPLENGGCVDIYLNYEDKTSYKIKILDNGVGILETAEHKESKRIGISNVIRRIELFSKGLGRVEIRRVSVSGGTKVEIILPLYYDTGSECTK